MKSHDPDCRLGDKCRCDERDAQSECAKCGGELEEAGTCENFVCPAYVPPATENQTASLASPSTSCSSVVARIKAYLTTGGAFNPELADHVAVRDLLIDCRDVMLEIQKGKRWATPSLPLAPNCRL